MLDFHRTFTLDVNGVFELDVYQRSKSDVPGMSKYNFHMTSESDETQTNIHLIDATFVRSRNA